MTVTMYMWVMVAIAIMTVMIVDKNAAEFFILTGKLIDINIRRYILMIKLHPRNPFTNWMMGFKMNKMAKQLREESKSND